jgi:rubrerythrin
MKRVSEENLRSAYAGESQAHMRYLIYADKAEKEGYENVARLFRAIAYAERIHATNHYKILGMIRETGDNLQTAIEGEKYEVEEMYPAYKAVAELQREVGAEKVFDWALQAEKIHASMYQRAKQSVEEGADIKLGPIYICEECGYTVEGEEPERCPVCKAPKDKFRKF